MSCNFLSITISMFSSSAASIFKYSANLTLPFVKSPSGPSSTSALLFFLWCTKSFDIFLEYRESRYKPSIIARNGSIVVATITGPATLALTGTLNENRTAMNAFTTFSPWQTIATISSMLLIYGLE
eukprot:NODE_494_length_7750_cov_0.325317.p5 type:complete len:126 gc:universal NODE_494_length_7750_cov_0.325317:4241-4618(+)